MNGVMIPILTAAVFTGAAVLLGWLAMRRGGLTPMGACVCGYSLAGNETGVCPECGAPADESVRHGERRRLTLAARRLLYWVLAVLMVGGPTTAVAARLAGVREYVDCGALLIPKERLLRQAELRWRVTKSDRGSTAGAVEVRLTGLDGTLDSRSFTAGSGFAERVGAWAVERCVGGKASPTAVRACAELAETAERAAGGAEVVLAGVDWTLAARPTVLTRDQRMLGPSVWVLGCVAVAVWGGRRVVRRVME